MEIKIKYHTDIDEVEIKDNGDWIDLRSAETVKMNRGDFKLLSLGISMELPLGYEAYIVPRSSTFRNFGILQVNGMAIIDNSFSGDEDIWKLPILATRNTIINKGDRICQFRLNKTMKSKIPNLKFTKTDNLEGENRGGHGSSGIR